MAKLIHPVILCGGAGTRLWPASRDSRPKQFLKLLGPLSTLQETVKRVADPEIFGKPIIVTNRDYRFLVREQLDEIGRDAEILLEPARRDFGPGDRRRERASRRPQPRDARPRARRRSCRARARPLRRRLSLGARRRRAGPDRHLRLRARPSGDGLWLHQARQAGRRRRRRQRSREVRREARCENRRALHQRGLSLEFRQLSVSRRHLSRRIRGVRAREPASRRGAR